MFCCYYELDVSVFSAVHGPTAKTLRAGAIEPTMRAEDVEMWNQYRKKMDKVQG